MLEIRDNRPLVQFCFDEESGWLVHMSCSVETPSGRNPAQIDDADYRQEAV